MIIVFRRMFLLGTSVVNGKQRGSLGEGVCAFHDHRGGYYTLKMANIQKTNSIHFYHQLVWCQSVPVHQLLYMSYSRSWGQFKNRNHPPRASQNVDSPFNYYIVRVRKPLGPSTTEVSLYRTGLRVFGHVWIELSSTKIHHRWPVLQGLLILKMKANDLVEKYLCR